jgi:hypothetical protein
MRLYYSPWRLSVESVRSTDNKKWSTVQGVTKRCRLSLLTNSALLYESQCRKGGGGAGSQPMSTAERIITWHRAQINFGDLHPYLIYVHVPWVKQCQFYAFHFLTPSNLFRTITHWGFSFLPKDLVRHSIAWCIPRAHSFSPLHCKTRLASFLSPARVPGQGEFG